MKIVLRVSVICIALISGAANADYLVVSRPTYIKELPQSDAKIIVRVFEDTYLNLLDNGQQQNGYYHASTQDGTQSGWVYRNRVRRKHGSHVPADVPGASGTSTGLLQSPLCLYGCPAGTSASNDIVAREIYILSNNRRTKFADWVAYKVTTASIGKTQTRTWKQDPAIEPQFTMEPDDYIGAHAALHTDRGHQAPLASFTGTPFWKDTNYLSNITPQKSNLNQGPWQILESRVRSLAKSTGREVYVATGPLYERDMSPMPQASRPHVVPSGYWKVVAIANGSSAKVAAFSFDQETPRSDDICDHLSTVDDIERRGSLNLFSAMSDADEDALEGAPGALEGELGCN